ncbi:MAG: Hsp20/alpha crystallin family protein [Thermodesulfobacteriota bacterium]|nr:Hsp20/alpha crystallin family protein [Thermodesulfobacteriota bacterium]
MILTRNFFELPAFRGRSDMDTLGRVRRELGRLMDTLEGTTYFPRTAGVFPPVNLTEDTENYYLRAELPGIRAEDLDIQSMENNVTISGVRTSPDIDEKARFHRKERETGSFSRAVKMPGYIDNDKISAGLSNGILTITVPKAEAARSRQIKIQ